jgi:hypothetical protein
MSARARICFARVETCGRRGRRDLLCLDRRPRWSDDALGGYWVNGIWQAKPIVWAGAMT